MSTREARKQEAAAQAAERAALALVPLAARFSGQPAIVFAPGPSLPKLWPPRRPIPCPSIAVSSAWRDPRDGKLSELLPGADILYASDGCWWRHYGGVPEFAGMKVGIDDGSGVPKGIVVLGVSGEDGFDPALGWIRHGRNSGAAAIHLAAQLGANPIYLVGFDMRGSHYFGDHPQGLRQRTASAYAGWIPKFETLGSELAARGVEVFNATPGSALECFPPVQLNAVFGVTDGSP